MSKIGSFYLTHKQGSMVWSISLHQRQTISTSYMTHLRWVNKLTQIIWMMPDSWQNQNLVHSQNTTTHLQTKFIILKSSTCMGYLEALIPKHKMISLSRREVRAAYSSRRRICQWEMLIRTRRVWSQRPEFWNLLDKKLAHSSFQNVNVSMKLLITKPRKLE